jgi:hypothetical protein
MVLTFNWTPMMIKSQSLNPNADDEASIVTYLIILGVLLTRYQAPFILLPSKNL